MHRRAHGGTHKVHMGAHVECAHGYTEMFVGMSVEVHRWCALHVGRMQV